MQADRIQELETELSKLEAEARSRQELQSSAQAYHALDTKLGKAQQEQSRLRTERDKAHKAYKSWKMESENLRNENCNLKNMTNLMQANENPLKTENKTLTASAHTLRKEVADEAVTVEELERKLLASDRLATHNKILLDELMRSTILSRPQLQIGGGNTKSLKTAMVHCRRTMGKFSSLSLILASGFNRRRKKSRKRNVLLLT
jgi:chromosome segregation ATPase